MIGNPVVLSSAYGFSSNAVGAIGSPSEPSMLRTPGGEAMLVEDIQLWIKGQATPAGTWHEWEIKLGRARLTDGFVPPALCVRSEEAVAISYGNYYTPNDTQAFLWSLPRPLYVPEGATLQVKVKAGTASSKAAVAFRGRVLPRGYGQPHMIDVPYVGIFRPGNLQFSLGETDPLLYTFKSGAQDISNPFHYTLNVKRFVAGMSGTANAIDVDLSAVYGVLGSSRNFSKIQIYDSKGAPVSRDMIGLSQLCSFERSSLDVDFVMAPSDVLYMTSDQTHPAGSDTTPRQVGIGMVGWRQAPISEVR